MLVKSIMNTNVITADPELSIQDAAKVMTKYRVGSVIITKDKKILGILTERDILMDVVAEGKDPTIVKAGDIMTKDPVTIEDDKTVEEAADLMTQHKIKKLPVTHDGQLAGIITASDLVSFQPKFIENLGKLMMMEEKKMVAG